MRVHGRRRARGGAGHVLGTLHGCEAHATGKCKLSGDRGDRGLRTVLEALEFPPEELVAEFPPEVHGAEHAKGENGESPRPGVLRSCENPEVMATLAATAATRRRR